MPTLYYKNNNVWEQLNLLMNLSGSDLQNLRKEMGLGDTLGVLPIENGGTGATSIVDNTQLYNYLTGDGASSLTGNEPVFVKNLEELSEIFNVAGKHFLNFKLNYSGNFSSSGVTLSSVSVNGFSSPSKSYQSIGDSGCAISQSTCRVGGIYRVNMNVTMNLNSNSDVGYRKLYLQIGSSVNEKFYDDNRIYSSTTWTYDQNVKINANDVFKLTMGGDDYPSYHSTYFAMVQVTRVS